MNGMMEQLPEAMIWLGVLAIIVGVCVGLTDRLVPQREIVACGYCGNDDDEFTFEEAVDHGWGRTLDYGLCCDECLAYMAAGPGDVGIYGAGVK